MRLQRIKIKNFKAIGDTSLDLTDFNVIVGANGSGKSSVLQAMHWMFQSGRNRSITANTEDKAATLSEKNATYMPSPEYRTAAYGQEYGNQHGSPQLDISIWAEVDGNAVEATMWIKSARNEGLSVHIPSGNAIVTAMRDPSREFSAYIPGLAGIPLAEEKHSRLIVHRLAAAGDANTVLRNVLLLLKNVNVDGKDGLKEVQDFVSRVMGEITLSVEFDEDRHSAIQAKFQTEKMYQPKPLELAGIGFLQVVQIFAYLVYFRPVVLLVDEPDSHLHPTAQERLVKVLASAAHRYDTQAVVTTHSPSIVRALPPDARVIWMQDGEVQTNGDTDGRRLMGWGLLDRRVLLMSEDREAGMLQSLLAQWPDLDRLVAVWPFDGSTKLPSPEVISGLVNLTGNSLRVVLHRDRDFLMPVEISKLVEPYDNAGHKVWFTLCSDIESYWANTDVVAAHFNISTDQAIELINDATAAACANDEALKKRRAKRIDATNKLNKNQALPIFGDIEVETEACTHGEQHKVLGKDLVSAIRKVAQDHQYGGVNSFGKLVPDGLAVPMAKDLESVLRGIIA